MSTVVEKLRDKMHYQVKSFRALGRGYEKEAGRSPYRPGVKICLERARLVTQVYKETEGEPMVLRRAKALASILENMTIYIGDEERIVGNFASTPDSLTTYPELYWRWLDKAIDKEYKELLNEEERKELHQIHKYWQGKSVQGMEYNFLPEDVKPYWSYKGHFMWLHGADSGAANFEKLFQVGLKGVIKEAENRLKTLNVNGTSAREYLEQKNFLEACLISLRAATNFANRYAQKARELAQTEISFERKQELQRVADVCDWVPENPPRGLYEALQFFWFITSITREIELQNNGLGARFDQIMYPFYKMDQDAGRITREKAQELVEFLWLKMNESGQLRPPLAGSFQAGGIPAAQTITLGGVTREGDDATNEMTYIALDASKNIRLQVPMVAMRYHSKIPKELVYSAIDLLRTGVGYPAFYNDAYMIPMFLALGLPIEDVRDYAIEVCMRWTIPGKNITYRAVGGIFVLPKCLELALNEGIDKFTGEQLGPATPDPLGFSSIEDVLEAYLAQVRFFMGKLAVIYNIADALYEEHLPRPLLSALLDGCIEKGQDCRKWRYFAKTIVQPIGQITVADSLAAMKKLVFEEKQVTMAELLEALKSNWEGREDLRQIFLNKAPKFGNDDDYVDLIAREVQERTAKAIQRFKNLYGYHFLEDGSGGAAYYAYSGLTGATPDGRKDHDMFNDGTLSPVIGRDKKGPTAVLKSTSKVDPLRSHNHLLNQKFLPQYLEGENKELFATYLRTWADLGHHHIQFNVIDRATLLEAKKNPERYADLVVRVAGYSAYFVDLPKGVQDQIIERTEQRFC